MTAAKLCVLVLALAVLAALNAVANLAEGKVTASRISIIVGVVAVASAAVITAVN